MVSAQTNAIHRRRLYSHILTRTYGSLYPGCKGPCCAEDANLDSEAFAGNLDISLFNYVEHTVHKWSHRRAAPSARHTVHWSWSPYITAAEGSEPHRSTSSAIPKALPKWVYGGDACRRTAGAGSSGRRYTTEVADPARLSRTRSSHPSLPVCRCEAFSATAMQRAAKTGLRSPSPPHPQNAQN